MSASSNVNRRDVLKFAGLFAAGAMIAPFARIARADGAKPRILFFTKSAGFQHSAITRKSADTLSFAEQYLTDIGAKHGYEVTCSKDGKFLADNLDKFDAFAFYTTGDLTKDSDKYAVKKKLGPDGKPLKDAKGKDLTEQGELLYKEPGMGAEGKAAFLEAIKSGKGFMSFHSATDTFHSHGHKSGEMIRNANAAGQDEFDPYIQMIGGEFIIHGAQQKSELHVVDPTFPGAKAYEGESFQEEWYSLKNFSKDLHVIIVQDSKGMTGKMYERKPWPETWARLHGKGRVFYTSMGHREDVWQRPEFEGLVVGAMQWITRQIEADVTPNIEKVAPDALGKAYST